MAGGSWTACRAAVWSDRPTRPGASGPPCQRGRVPGVGGEDTTIGELDVPDVLPLLPARNGGEILRVEVAAMSGRGPRAGGLILTGQMGSVMQDSAQAALSYLRSRFSDFAIPADWFETHEIHLHVPAGAIPKDGPSAGATMACALFSLLCRRPCRAEVAMTGEVTLRGRVLAVGGL